MTNPTAITVTPDDEAHFKRPYMKGVTPLIRRRILIERAIVRQAAQDLLAAGFFLRLHNGEAWATPRTQSLNAVMTELQATDTEHLHVYNPDESHLGFLYLVYGNDGYDVIADNTLSIEPYLAGATVLSEKFQEE